MPSVQFKIDAKQFRQDLSDLIDRKTRGITTDRGLYRNLGELLVREHIAPYMSVDTGVSSEGKGFIQSQKSGYYREGYLAFSKGIDWVAYEHRPNGPHSYIQYAVARAIGVDPNDITGSTVRDALIYLGEWDKFLQNAKPLVLESMEKK